MLVLAMVPWGTMMGREQSKERLEERITVAEDGRSLVDETGREFFYLADTAWELFHKLTREEAEVYLSTRASQGFTVVQAVALAELDGLHTPNAYGYVPLKGDDPTQPDMRPGENDDYWDQVDWVVRRANEKGLYVALLPTWGCYWHDGERTIFNKENARAYGRWMGQRYRDAKVIWVLGGDRNPENESQRAVLRAMAEGLREGDGGIHLITYHPGGAWGSADFFHGEEWLDFNMRQNGHGTEYGIYRKTYDDYCRQPARPVIDGEPVYEDHPVAFDAARRGHTVAADCRRALYWDLFNGACGHTYGHHSVWQMADGQHQGVNNPLYSWREALHQPGAEQMRYARRLLEDRPGHRVPVTERVLVGERNIPTAWPGTGVGHFAATMDEGGSWLMVYAPVGRKFWVDTSVLKGERLKGWWFNPRNGKRQRMGHVEKGERVEFISPDPGEIVDWVLVVEGGGKSRKLREVI